MNRAPRPKLFRHDPLTAVVLIVNALVCLHSLGRVSNEIQKVVSARESVAAIARASSSIKDAEVAERTYLLTGGDHDLAKLGKAILKIQDPLGDLAKRSKGDPISETRVASLGHVVRERTDRLLDVAKVRKQGLEPAVKALGAVRGQRNAAEVVRLVTEMEFEEDRRLAEAEASARQAIGTTILTVLLASVLALAMLGVVSRLTRRETARREEAAEAIREREEWFSATLASISEAVIATDDRGRVRLINAAAQRLTGWTLAESKGRPLGEVFPLFDEGSRAAVESPVVRILSEGVSVDLANHTLLVARDGTEYPVEHSGAPIRARDGTINGVVLCFRNVAERKRAEVELRASMESADAANRAKDQFLAVLSHELRKPLTPVLMAVTGMLERGPAADVRPTLEMIRRNVEMESRLIDDLLDVSRIARGGLRLRTEVVDLHETIRQAVGMCSHETRAARLDVVLELSARRHHALADATRIMQVLLNLITNAVKFTPEGGRLECRTWNEEPAGRPPAAGRLVVEFRDSGIGIEPDSLARIFEPFEQGDATFARRYGGLGLGLSISRGIVESHGGRMSASSPGRGKGSVFHLELPLAPAPAPASVPPPAPAPAPRPAVLALPPAPTPVTADGLRLLLVEDDPDSLRYLALVLGQRGHKVATAGNLAAARAHLSGRAFDLLISDIELPDGSGLELAREHPGLPAIAVSGFGTDEDVRTSESAGFSTHLTKPIDLRSLEEAISLVASHPATG